MAIGLASVILIFIYIQDELTYDTIHPAPKQTFGIAVEVTNQDGEKVNYNTVPAGLAQIMKERIPEVVQTFRYPSFRWAFSMRNPENPDKVVQTKDGEVFLIENTFSDLFYFPLIQGNKREVFTHPNSIVISEKAAIALFGKVDVLGRQVEMKHRNITDQYISLQITGVMKNYPDNVHIRPDYLIPIEILNYSYEEKNGISLNEALSSMNGMYAHTYFQVAENTDMIKVEKEVDQMISDAFEGKRYQLDPFFRNITEFHFDKEVDWSWWNRAADFDHIIIFGSIGIMILLIACINYMNLATAKSAKRSREVGVRKSFGSNRKQLMIQFFNESLIITFLAFCLAMVLVIILLPFFNSLADKHFAYSHFLRIDILVTLLTLWLSIALISSSYPAVFLSGFKPQEVIKGKFVLGKGPSYFRRILVVLQLVVSVFLIISTGIILQQMNMLENTKLYKKADQIIGLPGGIAPDERYQTLKNEILRDPDIEEVTMAVALPRLPHIHPLTASLSFPDITGDQEFTWKRLGGDYHFPKVFDLDFIAGRSFEINNTSDSNNYIINETALKILDLTPDEIIGHTLSDKNIDGIVIGVVRDFHFESIHNAIKPIVIQGRPQASRTLYIKLSGEQLQEKISFLEETWREIIPGTGFQYSFLEDKFREMYFPEIIMTNLVKIFSILAVFIACLGLYGLSAYTAEQKTKEIGVRKVLGATVLQILIMIVSDFLKMIFISCIIALPLSYWLVQDWLQNFVYRVNIGWFIFLLSISFIVSLTLLTVAYESIKASLGNPTKNLRYE